MPSTGRSLPPKIDGQVYGFLAVEISRVLWMIRDPPGDTVVRIKWWGETGDGVCVWPAKDGRFLTPKERSLATTVARYAVLCGPKQFAAYLRDAGHLDLEVLANNSLQGKAAVPNLVQLSERKAIDNFFPVIKQNGGKIGRLHVHIVIEDMEGYRMDLPHILGSQIERHLDVPVPAKPPERHKLNSQTTLRLNNDLFKDSRKPTKPPTPPTIVLQNVPSNTSNFKRSAVQANLAGKYLQNEQTTQSKSPSAAFNAKKYHDPLSPPSIAYDEKGEFPFDIGCEFLEEKKDVGLDLEKTAIQTILGDKLSPTELRIAKILSGFTDSETEDGSVFSDPDPCRDPSLLQSLFYQESSGHNANEVGEEQDNPSLRAERKVTFGTDKKPTKNISGGIFKLGAGRIALLKKVRFVRVLVDHLTLATSEDVDSFMGRKGSHADKCSVCTLEYQFPIKASPRNHTLVGTETVKIIAKKVEDNVISFNHRSVFPITFSATTMKQWWHSAIQFRVFTKEDKEWALLGCAALNLHSVLESPSLAVTAHLLMKPPTKTKHSDASQLQEMGHRLKVKVELASDVRGFYSSLALLRKRSLPKSASVASTVKKEVHKQVEPTQVVLEGKKQPPGLKPSSSIVEKAPKWRPEVTVPKSIVVESDIPIPLHAFLNISQGVGFIAPLFHHRRRFAKRIKRQAGKFHGRITRNLYLECRIFDRVDVARSPVCWSSLNPPFNFKLVAPFFLSEAFLERVWNNYTVIEVWDKLPSMRDQLVGICKLPLHQFYLSFCKRPVVHSLLQSELPVIAVDGFLLVTDVVTHREMGQLQVTLALGSLKQVQNLQNQLQHQSYHETPVKITVSEKVIETLEVSENPSSTDDSEQIQVAPREVSWDTDIQNDLHIINATCEEEMDGVWHPLDTVSHTFSVTVDRIQGLQLPSDLIWGEADCFVTYDFPSGLSNGHLGIQFCQSEAVICTPNVVFKDSRHLFFKTTQEQHQQLPALLQKVCPAGIVFSVWCRRYSPSSSQSVIATATFPLSRLCALITRWNQGESSPKLSSSLPLLVTHKGDHKVDSAGLLSVVFAYSSKKTHATSTSLSSTFIPGSPVNSPGLEDAANSLSDNRPDFVGMDQHFHDHPRNPQRPVTGTPSSASRAAVPGIPRGTLQPTELEKSESTAAPFNNSFRAQLHIEQASRLSTVSSKERTNVLPNAYVTCDLFDEVDSVVTPVVEASDNPQWRWQRPVLLPAKLITDSNMALLFKLWHKDIDCSASMPAQKLGSQLLGLIHVDLATLVLGMDHVTGWYNVLSYDGQCRGQLKVSVTPLEDLSHFREKRFHPSNHEAPVKEVETNTDNDSLSRSLLINHLRHSLEELEKFRTNIISASAKAGPSINPAVKSRREVPSCSASLLPSLNTTAPLNFLKDGHSTTKADFLTDCQRLESGLNFSYYYYPDPDFHLTGALQKDHTVDRTSKAGLLSETFSKIRISNHSRSLPDLHTYADSLSNETIPLLPYITRSSSYDRIHRCSPSDVEAEHCAAWDSHSCCKHGFAEICEARPRNRQSLSEYPRYKGHPAQQDQLFAKRRENVMREQPNRCVASTCDPEPGIDLPENLLTTEWFNASADLLFSTGPKPLWQDVNGQINNSNREEVTPNVLNSHSMVYALDKCNVIQETASDSMVHAEDVDSAVERVTCRQSSLCEELSLIDDAQRHVPETLENMTNSPEASRHSNSKHVRFFINNSVAPGNNVLSRDLGIGYSERTLVTHDSNDEALQENVSDGRKQPS